MNPMHHPSFKDGLLAGRKSKVIIVSTRSGYRAVWGYLGLKPACVHFLSVGVQNRGILTQEGCLASVPSSQAP